jgi:hypothetical protein
MDLQPWQSNILAEMLKEKPPAPMAVSWGRRNGKLNLTLSPEQMIELEKAREASRLRRIEIEEKYGESTRVPIRQGGDRWMAVFEGAAADDLAGRSYTVLELQEVIRMWAASVKRIHKQLSETSWEIEKLEEQYKYLYKIDSEKEDLEYFWACAENYIV